MTDWFDLADDCVLAVGVMVQYVRRGIPLYAPRRLVSAGIGVSRSYEGRTGCCKVATKPDVRMVYHARLPDKFIRIVIRARSGPHMV